MAAILFGALTLALLYWFPARRWFQRWGSTATDLTCVMAGDAAVVDPTYSATLAITVDARPEHIWPWLVQMGYQRGGLYSYDRLENLDGLRLGVFLDIWLVGGAVALAASASIFRRIPCFARLGG